MDYQINIYNKIDQKLERHWLNLEKNSFNYAFQSFKWFKNWFEICRFQNDNFFLKIVVVEYKSEVIAIFPFEVEKKYNLRILKWAGDQVSDFCAPIIKKNFIIKKKTFLELFNKLLKEIKNIDIVELRRQPKFIDDLKNPFVNFLENYRDSKNFFILLPERWDFYKNNFLKKEFHSQNMRKKRSLKKLGKLQFEVYKDRDGKIQVLDKLFIQKNSRLKKLGIKELFESTDINFYKKISSENYDQNNVHVCALKLNGKLIAMHWGMIYKKRFYYLLLSMQEEELGRLSPGRILINLMIKWSIAKKLKFFDFTLGQETHKESRSNNESYLYNFISIKSTKGIFFFLLLKIKYFLKHIDKKNTILKILLKLKKF